MPTAATVIADYYTLSSVEQNTVKTTILSLPVAGANLHTYVETQRFKNGRVCPHCSSVHVVRNGKRKDGTQRYLCRGCKRSFVASACSIAAGTRKSLYVWDKFIECMLGGETLSECASKCGIHKNTAFIWRHKILDALQKMVENVKLDGIIEADETFFAVSYKGNHAKSRTFSMPRAAHKRGHMTKLRGLSHEKVCIPCAVNRNGCSIAQVSNLARVKIRGLEGVFDGKMEAGSVLVTDKASAYRQFATKNGLQLKQLKSSKHTTKGIYNIQRINYYHKSLKAFLKDFCGVSTKYLNNYLVWHNFVNYSKGDVEYKKDVLLSFVLSACFVEYNKNIGDRDNLPIVA